MRASPSSDPTYDQFVGEEKELALSSTRLFGESGLSLSFIPEIHYDVLDALDEEDFDELLITMFRGVGKTTMLSAWLARKIARDRDFRALVISIEDKEASKIVDMTRKFLEMPQIVEWYGVFESSRLWSKDSFEVVGRSRPFREATLQAAGVHNFRPGGHFNCIILDDPEDDKSTDDPEKMEATQAREALLAPMCDVGESLRITAGTFWNDSDLYMAKIENFGLSKKVQQADGSTRRVLTNNVVRRVPLGKGKPYTVRFFYKPVEDENGNPMFPGTKYDAHWIARKRMEMRLKPDLYAAQFKLDPVPMENARFRPEDFKFVDQIPNDVEGDLWCGGDFASSLKPGSDYSAFVVALITSDFRWYVMEASKDRYDSNSLIERLFDINRTYPGVKFVLEEDRYAAGIRGMIEERQLNRRDYLDIEWINAHARQKKGARIEAMQGLFRLGAVTFVSGTTQFLYDDLRRYPAGKRDLPDAMANIFEIARSAPPRLSGPQVKEEDFLEVGRVTRSRLNDEAPPMNVTRIRRMSAEEVPWRML